MPNFRLRGSGGGAMVYVLAFATIGTIMVMGYLAHQARSNTRALRSPATLQALLNARSGIYYALDNFILEGNPNTVDTNSAVNELFHMDMFDDTGTVSSNTSSSAEAEKGVFLYTNDTVNTADITILTQDIYGTIISRSIAFNVAHTVEARLGTPAPAQYDTVFIIGNALPINGRFNGKAHQTKIAADGKTGGKANGVADTVSGKPSSPDMKEKRILDFVSRVNSQKILEDGQTDFNTPLIVRSSNQLALIPDTVMGHLLLDGAFSDIVWSGKRKIVISGDLQITGSFRIENLEFSVGGEIRIMDRAYLSDVSIFSARRIFIGDDAVFSGNALTAGSINIYGNAEVKKRSPFISTGANEPDTGQKKETERYSILISENSKFDGIAIALGNPGGIKTDRDTKLRGIIWAQKAVCHNGRMLGIIKAEHLVDCTVSPSDTLAASKEIAENIFHGFLEPLQSIDNYKMPYFMGVPHIINWREY